MKITYGILIAGAVLALASCKQEGSGPENLGANANTKIWTAPATEKILLDQDYTGKIKESNTFELSMVRGEYESFQIIMTPDKDTSFDAEASVFTSGSNKLDSEDIEIYREKYVEVTNGTLGGANLPLGMYPDALLPLDKAVEYDENNIKANQNQGLWVTFKTDKDTLPGIYEGKIQVGVGGKKHDVNVKLNVVDYYLSEENTAKSVFPIERSSLIYGELDNTMDMYKKYVDFLLDYRMAAYTLPAESKNVSEYVSVCKEYAKDPRVPSYSIPVYYVYNAQAGDIDLDYEYLHDYIMAMVYESISSGVDMISKAYTYIGMIDEPEMNQTLNRARRITKGVSDTREKCAKELLANEEIDLAKREEYAEKIKNVDNLVTNKKISQLDGYVDAWVPLFDDFDSINRREDYQEGDANVWWYGCIGPKHPYPTYHIDDTLISSRILSWMQYDYQIEGNLYWETALYVKAIVNDNGQYERIPCNPYKEASRFPNVNGDGFLIYPGAPYGIDGPVASIRMHSIRDGLEEYELLKDLEERNNTLAESYGKKAMHRNDLLELIFRTLYDGTKVIGGSDAFFEARRALLNLLTLASSDAGLYISDVNYNKNSYELTINTKDGFDLIQDDKIVSHTTVKGGKEYSIIVDSSSSTAFNLGIQNNNTKVYLNLGGKLNTLYDSIADSKIKASSKYTSEVIDGSKLNGALSQTTTKINLKKSDEEVRTFIVDVHSKELGNGLVEMISKMYNPTDSKLDIVIYMECSDDPIFKKVYSGNLKPGANTLFINNLNRYDYDEIGSVKNLHIDIAVKDKTIDQDIYLDYISYISKEA